MLRYYSHSKYLRETYDFPVKKICVDTGFTCPNRDGAKGYGGCIYCNDKGSGAPYIESGTLLHRYYQKAPWKLFTETEYVELAVQCLELIPKNTVIQRLIGEAVPERLVAPGWSKNKQRVIQAMQDTMELRDTCQGARFVPNRTKTVRKSDKLRSKLK